MSREPPVNFDIGRPDLGEHLARTRHYLVGDILRKNARTHPDAIAAVGVDGAKRTYGELNDRVNQLANGFLGLDLDYGSTVAILSENRLEFAETVYAGTKLGALVPTVNWRLEREELLHCLEVVDADAVAISGDLPERHEWVATSDLDPTIVSLGDVPWGIDYADLLDAASTDEPTPSHEPTPEDGVTVFYTSGTTGLPKGTIVSHRALLYRALTWKQVAGLGPDFVAWSPMFHMVTTEPLFGVGIDGGTFYLVDGFDAGRVLELLASSDCGYIPLMPGVIGPLLEEAEADGYTAEEFESVDYIGTMADLVGASQLQAVTELFGAEYVNTFGSTEVGVTPLSGSTIPVGAYPTKDDLSKREGPLCDVKLVDESWNEVPQGEYGELAVRGPTLFSGYVGRETANREEFKDGWFRTGDMFVRNEDGSYDFIDRRKYLIKSGGENIYPAELERVLLDQPEVIEAVAVRVPDEEWGEVPKVYAALEEGAWLTGEELLERMRGRIASYKLPHYVKFVDAETFPRSTTGKVLRGNVEEWSVSSEQRVRSPRSSESESEGGS
ncbi:MAG: class I adenylate-forming enzyme family protein [Halapricum sp.]